MVARAAHFSSDAAVNRGVSPIQGTTTASPRRGLVLKPVGAYSRIPVARTEHSLHALEVALRFPEVDALRRRKGAPGADTVMRFARLWAASGDRRTGRDIAISHETIAKATGYKRATVKNAASFLGALGFLIEVATGANRLTRAQLAEARSRGGRNQTAVASTRALTIPRAVYGRPLPLSGKVNEISQVKKSSPKRACRPQGAAPRHPSRKKNTSPGRTFPIPMYRLASDLVNALPRLLWTTTTEPHRAAVSAPGGRTEPVWSGGRHIGHVCDALQRWRVLENGWTATEILDRITAYRLAARISEPAGDQLRDPLAWFVALLRRAITQHEPSPSRRSAHERHVRLTESAERRRADAEARARAEATRDESEAIIAAMWAQLPSRSGRTRTNAHSDIEAIAL